MKRKSPLTVKARRIFSRYGPLMFICQRAPIGQVLVQEARVLGVSGFSQVAKWSVALVSGLGAFDSVSGATLVKQVAPSAGSSTVPATNGTALGFVVQVTGAPSTAKSWRLTGTLPTGLTHTNATNSNTDSVTGIPRQNGSFPVTITAYQNAGYSGGAKSATFTITVTGGVSPPTISTQPGSPSISAGSTATLSVTSAGATSYQWYAGLTADANTPVAGATSASFTTPILNADANYWVKATNSGGSVNSNTALVTVITPPAITGQPDSTSVNPGGTAVLSVTATGTTPAFQWYLGDSGDLTTAINGATSSTYTASSLAATSHFWVRVSNSANAVNSNTAIVTVTTPPAITSQPASTTIAPGGTATLNVGTSGTAPSFQWYNGTSGDMANPIAGATNASFTTPALPLTASYWVYVSNSAGHVNSNTVTVKVADTFATWAAVQFTTQSNDPVISGPNADPDGDGLNNTAEFVFGTLPLSSNPPLTQTLNPVSGQISLSFNARAAAGPGYAGFTRHFAVESSATLGGSAWTAVAGYTDIIATGQNVAFTAPSTGGANFYRVKAWLTAE